VWKRPFIADTDEAQRLITLEDDNLVELARKHDLVLYDPQGPSFHSTADENVAVAQQSWRERSSRAP
jgi:hypothetical protein